MGRCVKRVIHVFNVPLLKYLPHEAKDQVQETELRWVLLFVMDLGLQRLHECVYQGDVYVYEYAHFAETDVKMTWEIFRYYKQHATVEELTWTNPSVEEQMANDTKEPCTCF